jgi:hypothetical protein
VGVMGEEDGLEDGSTWPSSRDWELGAAKADAVLGMVVVLILGEGGGIRFDWIPVCLVEKGCLGSSKKKCCRLSIVCAHAVFEMLDSASVWEAMD